MNAVTNPRWPQGGQLVSAPRVFFLDRVDCKEIRKFSLQYASEFVSEFIGFVLPKVEIPIKTSELQFV